MDQGKLTGGTVPVTLKKGDLPMFKSDVLSGQAEAVVESTGVNTFWAKTELLLQPPESSCIMV